MPKDKVFFICSNRGKVSLVCVVMQTKETTVVGRVLGSDEVQEFPQSALRPYSQVLAKFKSLREGVLQNRIMETKSVVDEIKTLKSLLSLVEDYNKEAPKLKKRTPVL